MVNKYTLSALVGIAGVAVIAAILFLPSFLSSEEPTEDMVMPEPQPPDEPAPKTANINVLYNKPPNTPINVPSVVDVAMNTDSSNQTQNETEEEPDECESEPSTSMASQCYYNKAMETDDPQYCYEITDGNLHSQCYKDLALKLLDGYICEKVASDKRKECKDKVTERILLRGDPVLCLNIPDVEDRAACIWELTETSGNAYPCVELLNIYEDDGTEMYICFMNAFEYIRENGACKVKYKLPLSGIERCFAHDAIDHKSIWYCMAMWDMPGMEDYDDANYAIGKCFREMKLEMNILGKFKTGLTLETCEELVYFTVPYAFCRAIFGQDPESCSDIEPPQPEYTKWCKDNYVV